MSDRQGPQRLPKSPEQRHLGAALRELREDRGVTQAVLAARAGIERRRLAAIERGEVDPTFVTLIRLVRAIPASLAELMRRFEARRGATG